MVEYNIGEKLVLGEMMDKNPPCTRLGICGDS
jgi:hypothetical protein